MKRSDEENCELRKYKWNEDVIFAVASQFKQLRNQPEKKKDFGASTGFEPVASAFAL